MANRKNTRSKSGHGSSKKLTAKRRASGQPRRLAENSMKTETGNHKSGNL